ncbi:hypothetical protein F2Q69_00056271 [Brassica cretica]|uniref:Endonuclease/exonuclease/phosphatase domain-containing protein n=1 Tax=Brassica cretica TaxID=69181 RepID=A0A8S9N387_BRACR|nr:hypothetical protein F2Q69_00056271 [Brassica cretica]
MSSASSAPINPSGFQLGPSTEGCVTGSVGVTKTQRRRPQSWKRRNAGKDLKCRLDRCFGNDGWFKLFPRANTEYKGMYASDHRLIKVSFALEPEERGCGRFYFDQRMIGKEGFEEAVIKGWNMDNLNGVTHIMDRIASCRRELARWKRGSNINHYKKTHRIPTEVPTDTKVVGNL